MIKYISIFRLVLRCLLVARKENSTGFSTGLTGRSKNLDPTGNPTGRCRLTRPVSISALHHRVVVFRLISETSSWHFSLLSFAFFFLIFEKKCWNGISAITKLQLHDDASLLESEP